METTLTNICWNESEAANLYDCLAQDPGYWNANKHLVSLLKERGLHSGQTVVDAGSGTGVNSLLLIKEILETKGRVIGVDYSESMVRYAREKVSNGLPIEFRVGDANRIATVVEEDPIHAIVAFNLVHLLEDLLGAMREWYEKLPDGGILAFSSTVYEGAIPREARRVYWKAILGAHRLAKEKFPETMGTRKKMLKHTPDYYFTIVEQAGFIDVRMEEKVFTLSKEAVLAFVQVPGMADSMMAADIPACAQREMFVRSIEETVTESLPRKTVFITARKKEARYDTTDLRALSRASNAGHLAPSVGPKWI
ncbi:MAG: class I SAM-dependent methyltransferase [Thermodesulfobacteriota bacterium]|nr:class I SAM-dependent methyltransferase [Thermodesulfobacteriota bacterium]